jgi:hypothetical protein
MASFPWPDLLPELQVIVRRFLDEPTARMLSFTCHQEVAEEGFKRGNEQLFMVFWDAARLGHLAICQWIYNATKDSVPEDKEDDMSYHYHALLLYDDALWEGHFHVADWAKSVDLPVRHSCAEHLMMNNRLKGLQWMVANGLVLPKYCEATKMPMIRWLVEEQHILPHKYAIENAFRDLPDSKERLLYYLTVGQFRQELPARLLGTALENGRWDIIDFLCEHCPEYVARFSPTYRHFATLYAQRPNVPWWHHINLDSGEVVRELVSDSDW